ncbi:VOC family protein [Microscilla marina]|uniref:Glyoxalase family protein n=1 Tax=Microscilla marina ATCC 23134 TaxID=313606 RepID=A1ZWU1_MICM2|nr:VOC family protein [Microscilla marina]EAY25118.1 glyoxalase family protein [Microscilla marina ATCC 23134]
MANAINWFEIPANNLERAVEFYKAVLGGEFHQQETNGVKMAFLPMDGQGQVGGALCKSEMHIPSADGAVVYLNGGKDLSTPLSKVTTAGGEVVMPKTKISDEIGYMAFFMDTEGNKVAFHSPN